MKCTCSAWNEDECTCGAWDNSGWQPIATGPKETEVLVWDGKAVFVAQDDGHDWYELGDGVTLSPTHWMPLPEPPAN